ncbi:hypothetical protein SKAU_G00200320 [Synaphobranchus kaupii]|uniref:Uncharacterized protein n=1 Tax=Synaphobranchus kaupii TaxID=118154 RepID=A0A9Q1FFT2_SYNKA|nr:hypothetical protein SKAU_G00200320 [Synaphobranchus kaupii]
MRSKPDWRDSKVTQMRAGYSLSSVGDVPLPRLRLAVRLCGQSAGYGAVAGATVGGACWKLPPPPRRIRVIKQGRNPSATPL